MSKPTPLPRLVPVPADPPYDDDGRMPVVYGALALACAPTGEPGYEPAARGPIEPDERRLRGLGQAVAEILAGRRPPDTVQDRLTDTAYAGLVRAGRMIESRRPPLVGAPHIQRPRAGVIEMCLLVNCGHRSRVLALRLERYGIRWLVTDIETA
ncbi:hypothetical protein J5X84_03115 [Streptosporangiaceae bacterium NEAU-GS5]|nr:hypothetical protein [Streptosporangiaceae bacterium NEAU-GS5]